jgi:hypothetical protein
MKKLILLATLFLCSLNMFSQESNTANVYVFRATGTDAIVSNFRMFVDGTLVCKLKNNKYSVHQVQPGKHEFSVQINGSDSKKASKKFEMEIEAGKTYYLEVKLEGDIIGSTSFEEVTENTYKKYLQKIKPQTDCLK